MPIATAKGRSGHRRAITLFDEHLLDAVAGVFPVLHVGIFLDDQRAQVLAVEHQDVGLAGGGIEAREGADDDAEGEAQVAGQDGGRVLLLGQAFRGRGLAAGELALGVLSGLALAEALSAEVIEGLFWLSGQVCNNISEIRI